MREELREVLQALLVPHLDAIRAEIQGLRGNIQAVESRLQGNIQTVEASLRGEMKALEASLRAEIHAVESQVQLVGGKVDNLDMKVEAYRRETHAEIHRIESTLAAEFVRMESIVDVRLQAMGERIDNTNQRINDTNERIDVFRRELLAEIKAAAVR